jgi:hypothetical protein
MYNDYLYQQADRQKTEYIEKKPKHIKYLLNEHNLKQLHYGEQNYNCINFLKIKKSQLNCLNTIFSSQYNCLVIFKHLGYGFVIETSMISKIPLLDKYYSGSGFLLPKFYTFNNHNQFFYAYDKNFAFNKGCQVIVLDLSLDLPFIDLILQVPKIIKYTSFNGQLYDNFLGIIYYNLSYEYTNNDFVPKGLIYKYLRSLVNFLGIEIVSFDDELIEEAD